MKTFISRTHPQRSSTKTLLQKDPQTRIPEGFGLAKMLMTENIHPTPEFGHFLVKWHPNAFLQGLEPSSQF